MRIAVTEIVKEWGLSKATIYRAVQLGKLEKGDDGLIDIANVVMLWGEPDKKRIKRKSNNQSKTVKIDNDTNEKEKALLSQVKSLQEALDKAEADKQWLKQQFEQVQERVKLLEHKPSPPPKNGLFNKLVKAITG